MIYDINSSFSGDLSYHPDRADVAIPLDSVGKFFTNKIKIQSSKLDDIETAFGEYQKVKDDVLAIDVHNKDQYERVKGVRHRYGIDDSFFDITIDDLSNKGKVVQFQNKAKRFFEDQEMKSIFEEQKKANKFMEDVNKISGVNEPLGIIAKKDFLDRYASKEQRTFGGFDLNIEDYLPMDVDAEMEKLAKDIEREYRLEKDPNSPVGDGYIFVNKISGVTENGRDVFQRKIDQLSGNRAFQNNIKSYIALNSPNADYNDPQVYRDFITVMMEDHLGDKVVSVESKKVDADIYDTTTGGGGTSTKKVPSTLEERKVYEIRQMLENNPAFNGYDFSGIGMYWGSSMRLGGQPYIDDKERTVIGADGKQQVIKPTGDLIIPVISGTDNASEIRIPKMGQGQKRSTIEEEYGVAQQQQAQQQAASGEGSQTKVVSPGDLTINNPDRMKKVEGAGITGVNKGGYTQDGQWVYVGKSGKVVVIEEPVSLADNGFKLKPSPEADGVKGYHLSASTADKAKKFHDALGYDYRITEAGIDTLPSNFKNGHKNPMHYDGTSYDFSLMKGDMQDPDKIFEAMYKGSLNDLDVVFETKDAELHNKVLKKVAAYNAKNPGKKIKSPLLLSAITGSHFSVYDRKPVSKMIKPGDVKSIDYAGRGNEEYAKFVTDNDLQNSSAEKVVEMNSTYLRSGKREPIYNELARQTGGVISFGDSQEMVNILAQSKSMEDYLVKNPVESRAVLNFIKNPMVQEKTMDFLLEDYTRQINNSKKDLSKWDQDELFYIVHHDGSLGEIEKYRNGDELLADFGMDINKAKNSLGETEYSIYRIAYLKANGEITDDMSVKNKIGYIESNPKQYSNQYIAANPGSTALGKYQIVWSLHKDKIAQFLTNTTQPVTSQIPAPTQTVQGESIPDVMGVFK